MSKILLFLFHLLYGYVVCNWLPFILEIKTPFYAKWFKWKTKSM